MFNSAVIIDRQGKLLLLHRKLNELVIGHDDYEQGDRLNVCHTELGTLGLMICADGFAHDRVLTRALGYMGADVIFPQVLGRYRRPRQREDPYGQLWRDSYMPCAKDFSMWIWG